MTVTREQAYDAMCMALPGVTSQDVKAATNAVMALLAAAPQPKVLWRGDLNDLLHAVNGTPIMSLLLDAAVAPDDPDAHKIRVVITEDSERAT